MLTAISSGVSGLLLAPNRDWQQQQPQVSRAQAQARCIVWKQRCPPTAILATGLLLPIPLMSTLAGCGIRGGGKAAGRTVAGRREGGKVGKA